MEGPYFFVDGSNCWVGKGTVILKGSVLEDSVVVGTRAIVSNQVIRSHCKVISLKGVEI